MIAARHVHRERTSAAPSRAALGRCKEVSQETSPAEVPTHRLPVSHSPRSTIRGPPHDNARSHGPRTSSYWYAGFRVSLGPTSWDDCHVTGPSNPRQQQFRECHELV